MIRSVLLWIFIGPDNAQKKFLFLYKYVLSRLFSITLLADRSLVSLFFSISCFLSFSSNNLFPPSWTIVISGRCLVVNSYMIVCLFCLFSIRLNLYHWILIWMCRLAFLFKHCLIEQKKLCWHRFVFLFFSFCSIFFSIIFYTNLHSNLLHFLPIFFSICPIVWPFVVLFRKNGC